MLFRDITLLDGEMEARQHMYAGIRGEYIEYIGDRMPDQDFGEVYDGKDRLLMAGFYNSHAHSPMTLLRGYGENMTLQDWLNKKIFPFEAKLTGEDVYWGTMLAMAESLRYGIVSTTDMYYFTEYMAEAVDESGCKNNISRSITNFSGDDLWNMDSALEMKKAYEELNGTAGGRIIIDMSLHAEYTSTPETVSQLAEYTSEIGANMHVHVSETKAEHESCKEKYGMTPVAYLDSHGLFETPTTAAHCVWIEGDDYDILKEKGVTVACNPVSNMKLASGICDVQALLDRGINVAVGTDSVASNNSLNILEDMKLFALAPKAASGDPAAVTVRDALKAATVNGAMAQGRHDCGRLEKGFRADLTVLDISGPSMHPVHDMKNNVLYSASGSNVVLTMADGKVLYSDGEYKTIDIEKTIYETEKAKNRILSEL
mgnify:CR=1 FL=1